MGLRGGDIGWIKEREKERKRERNKERERERERGKDKEREREIGYKRVGERLNIFSYQS